MAVESDHVRASAIGATEFPDLVRLHQVTGVPKTVVDGTVGILGALPEEMFVKQVLAHRLPAEPGPAT